jgi:cytoskeletal protein CcmA (bactofilin family)
MWKKTKDENSKSESPPLGKSPIEQSKEQAVIGPSISIKGELSGEEDLMIQGRVEGTIELKNNNVTVGRTGHIKADIYGKVISIEGEVQGNLFGEEKIVVRESGVVRGNMRTPRFSLEDGAKFKGSIDMIRTMEESSQHKKK